MSVNKVLRLKADQKLKNGIEFKKDTEIQIVTDIVYIGGYPLDSRLQLSVLDWIALNPNLFLDDTGRFI